MCGIFECSPQLEKCFGSASTELRGQKVFILCQVEPCKICVTLCSCGSRVMFAFLGVACAKLRLEVFVFLFHNQSSKKKKKKKKRNSTRHSPFQKCGGVVHHDCNARLGRANVCQMCCAGHRHRKSPTPSDGRSGYHKRKWRDFLLFTSAAG